MNDPANPELALVDLVMELYRVGVDLAEAGQFEESLACMNLILQLSPDNVGLHFSLATSYLSLGRFAEAAPHMIQWFELSVKGGHPHLKTWQGEDLTGKTLLVVSDQGIGDMVQFMRFLPEVAKKCGRLYFRVKAGLHRLIGEIDNVVVTDAFPAEFDYITNLETLPHVVGIDPAKVGAMVPYLKAEPERVEFWKKRLPEGEFRIGIAWGSGPQQADGRDIGRGIPLAAFAPLARIPGVKLISLQMVTSLLAFGAYPDGVSGQSLARQVLEQLDNLPDGMSVDVLGPEFNAGPDNVIDTVAVMASLDLVISCDTSVPHIAGACGFPAWVVLRQVPDWRWMQDIDSNPWYPTMRVFRQTSPGDWDEVMRRVAIELAALVASRRPAASPTPAPTIVPSMASLMVSTLYGRGIVLLDRTLYAEAAAALQKALALDPEHGPAIDALALACLHRSAGLPAAEAEAILRKALALRPNFPPARDKLAEILTSRAADFLGKGCKAAAKLAVDEATLLRPAYEPAKSLKLSVHALGATPGLEREELARAETQIWNALAARPADAALRRELAANLRDQALAEQDKGNLSASEVFLRKSLTLWPDYPDGRHNLAVNCYARAVPAFNSQHFAEAETYLWEALSLKPDFPPAANLLDLCARHPARNVVKIADPAVAPVALKLLDALETAEVPGGKLVRVGAHKDGGYVMLDDGLDNVAAYSLGIGGDVSWDSDMAGRGCQIYQYDHTIEALPAQHANFHWSKLGVAGWQGEDPTYQTLERLIANNGHQGRDDLVLKIDIEGAEWAIFALLPDEILNQFSQIAGEFHNLSRINDPYQGEVIFAALDRINRLFQLVHVHPNNQASVTMLGGVMIYNDVELTFVRRAGKSFAPAAGKMPHALDYPCKPDCAEYVLRSFGG